MTCECNMYLCDDSWTMYTLCFENDRSMKVANALKMDALGS